MIKYNFLLIFILLIGCFFQNRESVEQGIAKPVFQITGLAKMIPADHSGEDEYIQYSFTVTHVKDSIFYYSPSEGSKLYYPFGYEYVKLNEDSTIARTSVLVERLDTVKSVILPGKTGQFHFSIPRYEIASDSLIFRFIYFDNSNFNTEKIAKAILLQK
jgi:hypothetical protein